MTLKSFLIYLQMCMAFLGYWSTKPVVASETPLCPADLDKEITAVIEQPQWQRSRWGILIETLDGDQTLYSLASNQYFLPASSLKLLTTAAALTALGPLYQIRTPIYAQGTAPHLTSLRVVGRGDPSLKTADLEVFVETLKSQGIQIIDQLIAEDIYFSGPVVNPTWEWFDVHYYYGVAVNSLILNENQVTLTILPQGIGQPGRLEWSDPIAARQWFLDNQTVTKPEAAVAVEVEGRLGDRHLLLAGELEPGTKSDLDLAIPAPGDYFLNSLDRLLLGEGIRVIKTQLQTNLTPEDSTETEIYHFLSPPLQDLIATVNQDSNNLYGEVLLKIVELEAQQDITAILTQLGVSPDSYHLADGSGLSRHNLVSPQALVETLKLMHHSPNGTVYRSSLPLGGVSGTLEHRFRDTAVEGHLWAKTGGLTGVASLSGYLYPPNYSPLAFTIIINQAPLPGRQLHQGIDQIIFLLNRLQDCS